MKRKHSTTVRKFVGTTGDIKADLSKDQLAEIGACSLAYNRVEEKIDDLFAVATGLDGPLLLEVRSRINGIDGKIEIIKRAAELADVDQEDRDCLAEALGNGVFGRLKGYRNAAVHAILINAAIGVGLSYEKRTQINEVLLSLPALNALYEHLIALRYELECATSVLIAVQERNSRPAGDPVRASHEAGMPAMADRFRRCRARRQSLPPIPEFPSEAEFQAADAQWQESRMAALMSWRRELSQPLPRPTPRWLPGGVLSEPPPLPLRDGDELPKTT